MAFFGTVTERVFREKNPKHGNIYKMMQRYALDFFRETRSVTVPRFGVFQDSRIRASFGFISMFYAIYRISTEKLIGISLVELV